MKKKKETRIILRVEKDLKEDLVTEAKQKKQSLSALVRECLLKDKGLGSIPKIPKKS